MGRWTAILGVALAAVAARAEAQQPDFLLAEPRGSIGFRGGWLFASAKSDLFEFFSEDLTIEEGAFDAPVFGVDVGIALHEHVDVVVGFEFSRARESSEYREFIGSDDLPIEQQTELTIVPVTGSLKLYLVPKGRAVSQFAFVPNNVRPYVGGGGGFVWYKLEHSGEFIDFETFDIFEALFRTDDWGTQAHAFGGVDIGLGPKAFVSVEGRYQWAEADVGGDFEDFDPIDLNGLRITGAIQVFF